LTKRNNRLKLNRVQSKIRFNQTLPDDLEITCQVYDSYLNTLMSDFNPPKLIKDKFYGSMGCNGTITFEFNTPFYLWLLENM
jgi:hypothetical protein